MKKHRYKFVGFTEIGVVEDNSKNCDISLTNFVVCMDMSLLPKKYQKIIAPFWYSIITGGMNDERVD